MSLLHDVGGPALSARHASLKKTEISESCQKLFAGESIVEPEVKAAALAWVPNAMRFLDAQPDSASSPATEDAFDIGDSFADGGEPGVPEGSAAGELEGADA